MTRDEAKELLPLIQALADGKKVSINLVDGKCCDTGDDRMNILLNILRSIASHNIKPEPREIWVNMYPNGFRTIFNTEAEAHRTAATDRIECVRFVEVM